MQLMQRQKCRMQALVVTYLKQTRDFSFLLESDFIVFTP